MSFAGIAALVVVSGSAVGWESSATSNDVLASLRVPPELRWTTARRMANAIVDIAADGLEQCQTGRCTARHVAALASRRGLLDRPRVSPQTARLRPERSFRSIARNARLSVDELRRFNPGISLRRLSPGDEVLVWAFEPETPGRSHSSPNSGLLIDGEPFPEGRGWVVRSRERTWGTSAAIDGLILAMRTTMAEHPGGQPLMIADMSLRQGGPMPPHLSHQSGRDVDVSYYTRYDEPARVRHVEPRMLDEKRTWTFLRTILTRAQPDYVFMSVALQVRLYEYAESVGEHPAWLARMFEYGPRGHHNRQAVVRLAAGHGDHMHIRFGCEDVDLRCERPEHVR